MELEEVMGPEVCRGTRCRARGAALLLVLFLVLLITIVLVVILFVILFILFVVIIVIIAYNYRQRGEVPC